jgi:hypothetical protein
MPTHGALRLRTRLVRRAYLCAPAIPLNLVPGAILISLQEEAASTRQYRRHQMLLDQPWRNGFTRKERVRARAKNGYGPDESITSNCHIQTAFPPNRLDTAEHLSKLTGQTTIIKEQVTRSGRGLASQVSTTMHEVQRPLLTPDECLRMPGPQKNDRDLITAAGDMVVYCAGFPAIYGRQPLYFEDQTFAARAKIPAPKHSDSLQSVPLPEVQIV